MFLSFKKLTILFCILFIYSSLTAQEENNELKLFFEEDGQILRLLADNDKLYPLSVALSLELKGLKALEELPDIMVVPGEAHNYQMLTFSIPEDRSWSYKYAFNYYSGNAHAVHNNEYPYLLPYEEGERFLLSQGYDGDFSHVHENSLDFTMPEGTRITAARGGKVVDLKEDSNHGCPKESCNDDANYVRILHNDGTLADYYHLQFNGVLVKLNQEVKAGDVIALAGATGWASGSHLHFIVYQPSLNGRLSIPTLFKTSQSSTEYLQEGIWYTSIR